MKTNLRTEWGQGKAVSPLRSATAVQSVILLALVLLATPAFPIGFVSRHDMDAAEYQTEFNKWTAEPYNYRLISVAGYEKNSQAHYAAIWQDQPGPGWVTHPGMTKAQFDAISANYAADNMYPVFISGFGVQGQPYYNAIWEYLPGAEIVARVGLSHAVYVTEHGSRTQQGYKLVHLWTFNAGSTEYFTAIWRKGLTANYTAITQLTSAEYQQQFNSLSGQGYQPLVMSAAYIGGAARYSGVWKQPGDGVTWFSHRDLSEMNYQAQSLNWYYQGYRPVLASVHVTGAGRRFNMIVHRNGGMSASHLDTINDTISAYMNNNGVPGLSVAISRNGELVYAKGFGDADVAANEWVHPNHRFRIASVSKTLTSAAVLKLADHCGLDIDDTVFGANGILGTSFGTPPYSARERAITVEHLLYHTTGWTNTANGTTDGIWNVGGSDPDAAIDWQLDTQEPVNQPGTYYDYMNTDYVTAGRVIEKRSGKTYERFVQDELLTPSCVTEMEIGGSTLEERKPNEVVYYSGDNGNPYALNPSRMDANGGWIARPIDLLLFLRRIDGDSAQADILQPDSLAAMRTASGEPGGGANYGLGLLLDSTEWGHNGCMSGTISFLVYRNDGMAFAVTCNTDPATDSCAGVIKGAMNALIDTLNAANAWPNIDLFPCTVPAGPAPKTMADPRTFYVDGGSVCAFVNGQQLCSFPGGPFKTVNQGNSIICSGDRLYIRAGSYNESVTFNRYMTVRSYDGTAVIGD